jgi:hypothetical protein
MIKAVIKQCIPPILLSIIRVLRNKFRFYSTIHKHIKKGDTLFVLGNGPSLKEQLENSLSIITSAPVLCVNHFASSEYFEKIKPSVYVGIDPGLFMPTNEKEVNEQSIALWNTLRLKTQWNMDIVIPSQFRNNERIIPLKENPYINLLFVNMVDCSPYWNDKNRFKLFNKNKIAFPAMNVLNTSLGLAIFWKYKNIVLLGADSSWHEDIELDQQTNILYTVDPHFYKDVQKRIVYIDTEAKIQAKVHEIFDCLKIAFESYWLLKKYADFNSVSVFNGSGKSWIDAFERKSIEEIYNGGGGGRKFRKSMG